METCEIKWKLRIYRGSYGLWSVKLIGHSHLEAVEDYGWVALQRGARGLELAASTTPSMSRSGVSQEMFWDTMGTNLRAMWG